MRAKSSKQRCPALCILWLELLCSCRVGGWSGHLTASGSRYDFLGVDHEGRQTFRSFFRPHLNWKPTSLAAKTFFSFCFEIHIFLDQKPSTLTAITFFFLVFTYFWTKKGWHHEIPPRMPPFLATPLESRNNMKRLLILCVRLHGRKS